MRTILCCCVIFSTCVVLMTACGDANAPSVTKSVAAASAIPNAPQRPAVAPEACPREEPAIQSPPVFGPRGIMTGVAATCDPTGSGWVACNKHMHCPVEHRGGGICGNASCEIHTVYRKPMLGGAAKPIDEIEKGDVETNCQPRTHDLFVHATFVDFRDECEAGEAQNLTYCGSATGNPGLDKNGDGRVTCVESGFVATPVRWCIDTRCQCLRGGSKETLEAGERGLHDEPTRDPGCPGRPCRPAGNPCRYNYNPNNVTRDHCCSDAPLCVYPTRNSPNGTCQPRIQPAPQCVPAGGRCWLPRRHRRIGFSSRSSLSSLESSSLERSSLSGLELSVAGVSGGAGGTAPRDEVMGGTVGAGGTGAGVSGTAAGGTSTGGTSAAGAGAGGTGASGGAEEELDDGIECEQLEESVICLEAEAALE